MDYEKYLLDAGWEPCGNIVSPDIENNDFWRKKGNTNVIHGMLVAVEIQWQEEEKIRGRILRIQETRDWLLERQIELP